MFWAPPTPVKHPFGTAGVRTLLDVAQMLDDQSGSSLPIMPKTLLPQVEALQRRFLGTGKNIKLTRHPKPVAEKGQKTPHPPQMLLLSLQSQKLSQA